VRETGTAQAVSPPHSASKDAGGDLDAVFAFDGARRRTRTAGVPRLLTSYAASSADVEETSIGDLALRFEIVRRAPDAYEEGLRPDTPRRRLSSSTRGDVGGQRALCETHASELRILRDNSATGALARARSRAGA
jgi:hypothetical protein